MTWKVSDLFSIRVQTKGNTSLEIPSEYGFLVCDGWWLEWKLTCLQCRVPVAVTSTCSHGPLLLCCQSQSDTFHLVQELATNTQWSDGCWMCVCVQMCSFSHWEMEIFKTETLCVCVGACRCVCVRACLSPNVSMSVPCAILLDKFKVKCNASSITR